MDTQRIDERDVREATTNDDAVQLEPSTQDEETSLPALLRDHEEQLGINLLVEAAPVAARSRLDETVVFVDLRRLVLGKTGSYPGDSPAEPSRAGQRTVKRAAAPLAGHAIRTVLCPRPAPARTEARPKPLRALVTATLVILLATALGLLFRVTRSADIHASPPRSSVARPVPVSTPLYEPRVGRSPQ
jgi:hypothetical protein